MDTKTKILIGLVVLVVISAIMSSFSGEGDEEQVELDADRGGNGAAAAAATTVTDSSAETTAAMVVDEETDDRVAAIAKFKSEIVDPLADPQTLEAATKLMMKKFDLDDDGKISASEIPDGDLKTEMMGYDLNGDDILSMDEFREYAKNR
jgi:ABC-type Na+ efflux pump permease subunit